jgi:hypothetical protein
MPPMSNGHKNHEKSPKTSSSKSTDPNRAVWAADICVRVCMYVCIYIYNMYVWISRSPNVSNQLALEYIQLHIHNRNNSNQLTCHVRMHDIVALGCWTFCNVAPTRTWKAVSWLNAKSHAATLQAWVTLLERMYVCVQVLRLPECCPSPVDCLIKVYLVCSWWVSWPCVMAINLRGKLKWVKQGFWVKIANGKNIYNMYETPDHIPPYHTKPNTTFKITQTN